MKQVLAEYLLMAEAGEPLDQVKLFSTHPDLANKLQSVIANCKTMEYLAERLRAVV